VTAGRERLTGHITVALPPEQAYRLFTPRGEQDWAPGWQPRFPVPAPDDAEPGTVFETGAHGQPTIWLVTSREPGRRICYARVTPGGLAGTVTVTISPSGGHSEVEVSYQLTALTPAAEAGLREFARGYPAYLRSWQAAISGQRVAGPEDQHRAGPSSGPSRRPH
jgi:Polyketide cyclase / dehydrase and lipid transport